MQMKPKVVADGSVDGNQKDKVILYAVTGKIQIKGARQYICCGYVAAWVSKVSCEVKRI